jgi:hypothetical protein
MLGVQERIYWCDVVLGSGWYYKVTVHSINRRVVGDVGMRLLANLQGRAGGRHWRPFRRAVRMRIHY